MNEDGRREQPHEEHADHTHEQSDTHDGAHHHHGQLREGQHQHEHERGGVVGWLQSLFHIGGHDHGAERLVADDAFAGSAEGIRTIWLALALLGATTVIQIAIYLFSDSVALLADTVHNLGDALNTLPLLIAFYLSRRPPTRRYTYGYHRAEDVAGIIIVLSIAISAGVIFWESFQKLIDPEPLTNLPWVAAAAIIGFIGNEAVAILQIRTGERIGSAALVADGKHARTDGLTSLAVLVAAGGTALGYPIVDPLVGILIGITILFITRDAVIAVWYRLMDAVEPELYDRALAAATAVSDADDKISAVRRLRLRWLGHRLTADVILAVDPTLTTAVSHDRAEDVRHALFAALPLLSEAIVHVEPGDDVAGAHRRTAHRETPPAPIEKS